MINRGTEFFYAPDFQDIDVFAVFPIIVIAKLYIIRNENVVVQFKCRLARMLMLWAGSFP
jgi:hypothetical protein